MAVIGLVRVLGALPVLRWPLAGALVAIGVDFADLFLMNLIDLGGLGDYQHFDKVADLAYMTTFLVVALRWEGLARRVAVVLCAYRLVGVAAYELAGDRTLLPFFPNVFEFWFLFVAARDRFAPVYALTPGRAGGWLAGLTAAKLGQEYLLHVDRTLDGYVATEVVADLWRRLRGR